MKGDSLKIVEKIPGKKKKAKLLFYPTVNYSIKIVFYLFYGLDDPSMSHHCVLLESNTHGIRLCFFPKIRLYRCRGNQNGLKASPNFSII